MYYELQHKMNKHAKFVFTTTLKTVINVSKVTINHLNQTLPNIQEVTVVSKIADVPSESFTIKYDFDGDGTYEDFDASKITKVGQYKVLITRPEDGDYQKFYYERTLTVSQKMATITYSVDPANMGESLMATLNGSAGQIIKNEDQVMPNSVLTFTFIPKNGYRLEKIL